MQTLWWQMCPDLLRIYIHNNRFSWEVILNNVSILQWLKKRLNQAFILNVHKLRLDFLDLSVIAHDVISVNTWRSEYFGKV